MRDTHCHHGALTPRSSVSVEQQAQRTRCTHAARAPHNSGAYCCPLPAPTLHRAHTPWAHAVRLFAVSHFYVDDNVLPMCRSYVCRARLRVSLPPQLELRANQVMHECDLLVQASRVCSMW